MSIFETIKKYIENPMLPRESESMGKSGTRSYSNSTESEEERRVRNAESAIRFRTDIEYTRIILVAVQNLSYSGLGSSREAIKEVIDGLDFGYDPIYRMLNEKLTLIKLRGKQQWLVGEFRNLKSMNIDSLIASARNNDLDRLITACDVVLGR